MTRVHVLLAAAVVVLAAAPAAAQEGAEPTITTQVVESFDGTPILSHLFLPPGADAQDPVPLVMRTHGWAGTGQTEVEGLLAKLLDAGYAVLTWDQRGFGCSGGETNVDKPDIEGKDASALIDWAVANAPIATNGGDPIVGFTGGSYAGGIQMATAALDPRIDALAPEIAWSDLRYSLYDHGVVNAGWANLLYGAGVATAGGQGMDPRCPTFPQPGGLAPEIHQAYAEYTATNSISESSIEWFAASSLAVYGQEHPVAVPTLVMNGSVDTLFDLTDGNGIYQHVKAQGAPAKYIAFCGGHVGCPGSYADAGDREHLDQAILTWFARYLDGEDVDTGAPVEYRTNEGVWRTADDFTPSGATFLTASGEGSVVSTPLPTQEPPSPIAPTAQVSRSGDPHAFSFEVAAAERGSLELVGIPSVTLNVTGQGPRVHLFAKLVDREAGEVVNLQEATLRVEDLGSEPQEFELVMPGIAYTLPEGNHLDLQIATNSAMHANAREPGEATVSAEVRVPVLGAPPARPAAPTSPAPGPPPSQNAPSAAGGASTLPTTGGAWALAWPLAALGLAAVLRRRC